MTTIFVDASAMVAMMTDEPKAARLVERLVTHDDRLTSAVALWEASRAVSRIRKRSIGVATEAVQSFMRDFEVAIVAIGAKEGSLAVAAHGRYGKNTGHPAQLNMGDCFAYACARTNGAALLYKGDDFVHTDLA